MAETFDPYRKWLGIPPSQQPPHHYRLLGIELFEHDVDVIDTAASQRMSYLQEVGNGPQVKDSQRLLNEVSAARRCLLDAGKKKAYDDELRAKLAAAAPATPPPVAPPQVVPAVRAKRLPVEDDDDDETVTINLKDVGQSARSRSSKPGKPPSSAGMSVAAKSGTASTAAESSQEARTKPRKRSSPLPLVIGLIAVVGIAAGGVYVVLQQRGGSQDSLAEDDSPVEHVAAVPPRVTQAAPPRGNYATAPAPKAAASATSSRPTTVATATPPEGSPPITNFFPQPTVSPAATAPKVATSATTPAATPTATVVAAVTPAAATPVVPSTPPPASFFGLDQAALPDVRPHFVPAGRTLRDLTALVHDGDVYHLFYNSQIVERKATTNVWGRAVSRDLFSWTDGEPVKIPVPDAQTPSPGSVVVDADNASGLGKSDSPPWLFLFTYSASGDSKKGVDVGLMFSVDKGKTWTPHEKNPILKGQPATSRWPHLIRHAKSKQWGLLLYASTVAPPEPPPVKKGAPAPPPTEPPKSTYRLFSSTDLLDWKSPQEILYPAGAAPAQLIELADSGSSSTRWMFLQGRGRYWFGEYDGAKFTTDRSGGALQSGQGYFGIRTASGGDPKNLPFLGVLSSSDSGSPIGAAVAFPRRLQLQGTAIAPNRDPIPAAWSGTPKQWSNHDLDPAAPLQVFDGGSLFRVQLQAQAEQAEQLRVTIFGLPVVFNFKTKKYQVGERTAADYAPTVVQIEGIVDVDLAELNIGAVGAVGFRTASGPDARTPLEVKAVGGKARITSLVVTPLKPPKPAKP